MCLFAADPSRSWLELLVGDTEDGILIEDRQRLVLYANKAFCEMFSIPVGPDALVGQDCAMMAEQAARAFVDGESFAARVRDIVKLGQPIFDETLGTLDGRIFRRSYRPLVVEDKLSGHIWRYALQPIIHL